MPDSSCCAKRRPRFSAETIQAQTQGSVFTSLVNLYKALCGGWVIVAEDMANDQAPRIKDAGNANEREARR